MLQEAFCLSLEGDIGEASGHRASHEGNNIGDGAGEVLFGDMYTYDPQGLFHGPYQAVLVNTILAMFFSTAGPVIVTAKCRSEPAAPATPIMSPRKLASFPSVLSSMSSVSSRNVCQPVGELLHNPEDVDIELA